MKCSSTRMGCLLVAKFSKAKRNIEKRPQRGMGAEAVPYGGAQSAESEPPLSKDLTKRLKTNLL